jgi:FkbM family methyltransferase
MSWYTKRRSAFSRLRHQWIRRKRARFYAQFIQRGDLCFDVGAHLGRKLELFVDLGARILAIEPDQTCVDSLRQKFGNLDQVDIVAVGLSADGRDIRFWLNDKYPEMSSFSPAFIEACDDYFGETQYKWHRTGPMPTTTLDALIEQYGLPDFCKLDVEGFEDEVLCGLSQPIQHLCLEHLSFCPQPAMMAVERLASLGNYRFNYSYSEETGLVEDRWCSATDLLSRVQDFPETAPVGCDIHARLR